MTHHWRSALVALVASGALPLVAQAQLRPAGPEFELAWSSAATDRRLAAYGYGNFLVLQGGGWSYGLQVQRYDNAGQSRGDPMPVAHRSINIIRPSAFAVAPSGEFLVAWAETDMGFCEQLYVLLAPNGVQLASGVLDEPYVCGNAVVTAAGNGDFVLAHQRPQGFDVRVHDRTGALITPPWLVSPTGRSPSLIADRDGNFWVSWSEQNADPGSIALSRRFDRRGHPLTDVLPGRASGYACLSGDIVRLTRSVGEDGNWVLRAEFLHPDGTPTPLAYTAPLDIPATTDTELWFSPPACDAANNLVVPITLVTLVYGDYDTFETYAARFRADGTRDGPVFRVSSLPPGGNTVWPAITADPSGDVLIAWEYGTRTPPFVGGRRARVFRIPPKGDFDADLGADIVLRNQDTGSTRLWMMDEGVRTGNVVVWPETPDLDWRLAGVDDFDGDRRQDLVFQRDASGEVLIDFLSGPDGNESVGGALLAGTPGPDWELAAVGDFSHDGWPDLLWRRRSTQQLAVWTLQRTVHTGSLVPNPDHAESADWSVVSAADWNGDGMRDLLWYNRVTGRLVQWLLDGDLVRIEGRFTNPPAATDAHWQVVAAGDFGRGPYGLAGTPDVVWRNEASGYQVIWFFDFDGNRTAGIYTAPAAPNAAWRACGPR